MAPSARVLMPMDGGRTATGADPVEFAKKAEALGAGAILPTSRATDGVKTGYDIPLTRAIAQAGGIASSAARDAMASV